MFSFGDVVFNMIGNLIRFDQVQDGCKNAIATKN
jgi:hypothetical protein